MWNDRIGEGVLGGADGYSVLEESENPMDLCVIERGAKSRMCS